MYIFNHHIIVDTYTNHLFILDDDIEYDGEDGVGEGDGDAGHVLYQETEDKFPAQLCIHLL